MKLTNVTEGATFVVGPGIVLEHDVEVTVDDDLYLAQSGMRYQINHLVAASKVTATETPVGFPVVDEHPATLTGLKVTDHDAPADGSLSAGDMALWFDQTNGAAKLMVKAKTANGTVVTGSVNLSA